MIANIGSKIRARVVRDRANQNPRVINVSSDITDRKGNEQALMRLNETLEERVTLRTSELRAAHAAVLAEIEQRERTEEQLRQAQKMEAIGQITGGVAHDFNNLLMAVLSNLELLRKHVPDDPKTARLISGALQGAKRGAALTQRLLAFARRQDLNVEPTNVMDLVPRNGRSRRSAPLDLRLNCASISQRRCLPVLSTCINLSRRCSTSFSTLATPCPMEEHCGSRPTWRTLARGATSRRGNTCVWPFPTRDMVWILRLCERRRTLFSRLKELEKGTGLGLSMVQGLAVQLNGRCVT